MVFQTSLGAGFRSLATSADQARRAGDHVRSAGPLPPSRRSSGFGRHFLDELPGDELPDDRGGPHVAQLHPSWSLERQNSNWSVPMSPVHRPDTPMPLEVEGKPAAPAADEARSCWPPPGRAWLYPDLPWGAPPMWQSRRMPGKSFLRCWDIITFLGCMYVAIMVPYLAGFIDRPDWDFGEDDGGEVKSTCVFQQFGQDSFRTGVLIVDMCVDCIFWIDILLSFHMAQWVICREGRLRHVLIDDLPTIRSMYVRGNFAVDVLGQIPWQYADCIGSGPELKLLRLFRMMKMLRLYRVDRMIQALYFKYPKSVFLVTMLQLLLYMFLCAHLMCCIWYFVSYNDPNGWIENDAWLAAAEVDAHGRRVRNLGYAWISGLYWAIATMTTIGYGDISANTEVERAVAVLAMLVGAAFFAWSCGKMTRALTDKSQCVTRFKDKWEEIEEFIMANDIPQHITDKIRSFYMLKFPLSRIYDDDAIMGDLPLGLRKEVSVQLFEDVVKSVPLFAHLSQATVQEICHRLTPLYQTMGLEVTSEGEKPDALYIVRTGVVSVRAGGEEVMEATAGDVFGENEILNLTRERRRNRTCVAKTSCELCRLSAAHFLELLQSCHDLQSRCRLLVQAHLDILQDHMKMGLPLSLKDRYCVAWKQVAANLDGTHDDQDGSGEDSAATRRWLEDTFRRPSSKALGRLPSASADTLDPDMVRVDGQRVLTTRFLVALKGVAPDRHRFDCFRSIKYAVVAAQYAGTADIPGSRARCFSDVVAIEQDADGNVCLDQELSIDVVHLHNRWATLPHLRVVLYAVFYPDSFKPPLRGYLPNLDDPLPPHEDDDAGSPEGLERAAPATPPPSARHSLKPGDEGADAAAVQGAVQGTNAQTTAWVLKASERVFQLERLQRERQDDGQKFSEADKAGIQALCAGRLSLATLVAERESAGERVAARLPAGAHAASGAGWQLPAAAPAGSRLVTSRLHQRGTFMTDVHLSVSCRVERCLPADSPWRRVLKAIKTLDPSRYFRNRSRQSVREVKKRFSALMRRVATSRQDEPQRYDSDELRGLTMLVKGLHASMNEMRTTLLDLQERLSNQEATHQSNGNRRPQPRGDKEDEEVSSAPSAAPRPHASKARRWRPAAMEIEQDDAAPAGASGDRSRQVHTTSSELGVSGAPDAQLQAPAPHQAPSLVPAAPVNCEEKVASAGDMASSKPVSRGEESAGKQQPRSQQRFAAARRAESRMDTSSSDGDATEHDSQCERPQMSEAASTRPSPVWQEKADEFLKQNVVQNFYT